MMADATGFNHLWHYVLARVKSMCAWISWRDEVDVQRLPGTQSPAVLQATYESTERAAVPRLAANGRVAHHSYR